MIIEFHLTDEEVREFRAPRLFQIHLKSSAGKPVFTNVILPKKNFRLSHDGLDSIKKIIHEIERNSQ